MITISHQTYADLFFNGHISAECTVSSSFSLDIFAESTLSFKFRQNCHKLSSLFTSPSISYFTALTFPAFLKIRNGRIVKWTMAQNSGIAKNNRSGRVSKLPKVIRTRPVTSADFATQMKPHKRVEIFLFDNN